MFWKLVKYELQSVRKWYLGIYGIAILLSIPLGLMLQKLTVTFEHIHKEPSLLFMAFFTLIVIATIVVWGTIYIATIVLIIKRFATSVFGREGYLTNTLPVSAHQLILSKLLAAFILDTISSLVVLASIGIIAAFNLDIKDILLTTSYFGQILKEMGCNAIRVTHNPAASVLLEVCNENGMLVINEAFDGWTEYKNGNVNDYTSHFNEVISTDNQIVNGKAGMKWGEFDVKAMVDGAKNDPSVIMWSLGNEIDEGVSGNTSHYLN